MRPCKEPHRAPERFDRRGRHSFPSITVQSDFPAPSGNWGSHLQVSSRSASSWSEKTLHSVIRMPPPPLPPAQKSSSVLTSKPSGEGSDFGLTRLRFAIPMVGSHGCQGCRFCVMRVREREVRWPGIQASDRHTCAPLMASVESEGGRHPRVRCAASERCSPGRYIEARALGPDPPGPYGERASQGPQRPGDDEAVAPGLALLL